MIITIMIIITIIIIPRAQVCNVSMAFARRLQSGNPASQGDFVRIYKVLSTLASSCIARSLSCKPHTDLHTKCCTFESNKRMNLLDRGVGLLWYTQWCTKF